MKTGTIQLAIASFDWTFVIRVEIPMQTGIRPVKIRSFVWVYVNRVDISNFVGQTVKGVRICHK